MRDLIVAGLLVFAFTVAGGAIWVNGYMVHQQDKLRADLYMAAGEREMQGRELDRCRIQRRDLREGK